MGTRADFYVRNEHTEPKMEWIGSIGWDGYPSGIDDAVLQSTTEEDYRANLKTFFLTRDDLSLPAEGWPWPWDDSRTTDYSYVFENGKVMASCFGFQLFDPLIGESEDESDKEPSKMENYFPDMTELKNIRLKGKASGVMIVTHNSDGTLSVE